MSSRQKVVFEVGADYNKKVFYLDQRLAMKIANILHKSAIKYDSEGVYEMTTMKMNVVFDDIIIKSEPEPIELPPQEPDPINDI